MGLQVQGPRDGDRGGHDQQRRRQAGHDEAQQQQNGERDRRDRDGSAADLAELADHLPQLGQRVAGADRQAEQLAELADDQDHGDPVDIADQHGT
jgi:hypothetical protein